MILKIDSIIFEESFYSNIFEKWFQELLKVQIKSEYRFPTLLKVQIILFYVERNSWKRKSFWISLSGAPFCSKQIEKWFKEFLKVQNKSNNGFRSSFLCKTFWILLSGVPESANLNEYRFQEFLKALFFLNRTKRSSWKCKSICFALSVAPLSINNYWLSFLENQRA